jgi:hypothetical protein
VKWCLVVPAAAALLARLLTGPHPIDDAYITFRYARNLATGLGLVYNPGEWVLGTTAPLWAIVLGVGYWLGLHDLPALASALSAVCDAGTAALLAGLSLRLGWGARGAALVGLVWAINPPSIAFAVGGMETSLFVFAALAALTLAASGNGARLHWAALLAGVSSFIRPEGVLLGMVIVGWAWLVARGPARLSIAGAFVAPGACGALTLWASYGSPLPHSIAAKQVAYLAPPPFENALALVLQAGLPGWSTLLLAVLPPAVALVMAAFGCVSLGVLVRRALVGRSVRKLESTAWQPFAAFAVLYLAFYALLGLRGVRLFPWYLVPIEPLYLLGAAAGLARLDWSRVVSAKARAWLPALLVLWQLPAIDWRAPLLPLGYNQGREQVLLDVGRGLAQSLPATALVAAPEIGALGYASNLRILDTVGLVSPAALPYYPLPGEQLVVDNAIPARLIDDQQPDVVVTLDAFARRSLLVDATFQRDYRLEHAYPVQVWSSTELLLFRRVSDTADAR